MMSRRDWYALATIAAILLLFVAIAAVTGFDQRFVDALMRALGR